MVILKADKSTISKVVENVKHATHRKPDCYPGEIILLQQTMGTLDKGQKSIRWMMQFVETYEDIHGESEQIWGKKWKYIIVGKNVRKILPFDISAIQVTDKKYDKAMWVTHIEAEDEIEILDWINDDEQLDVLGLTDKLEMNQLSLEDYINELNRRYSGNLKYKYVISKKINRPSPLRDAIIRRDGTQCKICKLQGFIKKKGGHYCEIHHMIELNKLAPDTLQSWNVLVVCPNCHKQLHHGNVITEFLDPGWRISIDSVEYLIR